MQSLRVDQWHLWYQFVLAITKTQTSNLRRQKVGEPIKTGYKANFDRGWKTLLRRQEYQTSN